MKAFTDIEQSKKLAEILPIESADMHYSTWTILDGEFIVSPNQGSTLEDLQEDYGNQIIPCWSLVALLALLPLPTLEEIPITDTKTKWRCTIYCDKARLWSELYNEPIDALVEAISIMKERRKF